MIQSSAKKLVSLCKLKSPNIVTPMLTFQSLQKEKRELTRSFIWTWRVSQREVPLGGVGRELF